jgi:hypothetical protein
MKTYNQLYKQILNEYQIEQTPNQPKNPIIDNLMNYLKKTGIDTSSINPTDVETILNNKQEQEEEEVDNVENTQQQPVQNIPNNSVKPNIVSNIPVNNLTSVQNKNIQKKI